MFTGTATEPVILDIHLHLTVLHTKEEVGLEDKVVLVLHLKETVVGGIGPRQDRTVTHIRDGRRQGNLYL